MQLLVIVVLLPSFWDAQKKVDERSSVLVAAVLLPNFWDVQKKVVGANRRPSPAGLLGCPERGRRIDNFAWFL